jgi:hypothetical protein
MDERQPQPQQSESPQQLTAVAATKSAERALRLASISLALAILALVFGIIAALIR